MGVHIIKERSEDLLFSDNRPVLELSIEYPQIEGKVFYKTEESFNRFYVSEMKRTNKAVRSILFRQALLAEEEAKSNGTSFSEFSFRRTVTVSYCGEKFVSLYADTEIFRGGTHGTLSRRGYTWDLKSGMILPLKAFYPKNFNYRHYIIGKAINEIRADKTGKYFDSASRTAAADFNAENFYLSEKDNTFTPVVFYPTYVLAPYSAGILTFNAGIQKNT